MTPEQILEASKLIALFMGAKQLKRDGLDIDSGYEAMKFDAGNNPNPHCSIGTHKRFEDLDYCKRWDWLMPVVEKIESEDSSKYIVTIESNYCIISENGENTIAECKKWDTKIENVFEAVVDFITVYNETSSDQA